MCNVTRILRQIENGAHASEDLLPLVYEQLRRLAQRELAREPSGQTIQPTALVHEAYLRLVDQESEPEWNHRGHFFSAAAQAMRRILIENARRKRSLKKGGNHVRVSLDDALNHPARSRYDLIAIDTALSELELRDPPAARLVSLRFFAGLTMVEAANAMDISLRTAQRQWAYAKAWLWDYMQSDR